MLSAKARVGTSPRPYLRNRNVQWGRIDIGDLAEMSFADDEIERFTVSPGDVLVCEGGEIGRTAIWKGQLPWVGYQKALHRIRPTRGVSSEYLAYLMRWFASVQAFEPYVTGSTIKHLPQENIRLLPVPVPPEREQRRIVEAIEKQFSRLDAAEELLRLAHRRLRVLRVLMFRSATDGILGTVPLADVADIVSGQTPKGFAPLAEGPVPFFKVGDMNASSGYEMASSRSYVDNELIDKFRLKVRPSGTVIFPKRGGAIATNKKRILREPAVFDLNTMGLVPSKQLLPKFLLYWLETKDLSTLSDGSNVPQINLPDIAPLQIAVPALDEQEQIVKQIEARLSTLDATLATTKHAQRKGTSLRRSILGGAFTGQLVSQDPTDEAASVLLERIAAARASEPKVSRNRRKVPA